MSFLREFENDIFISYAHIDNQPLAEGQKGWITSFHQALEIRLSQLLGAEPGFWRDESNLRGNDYLHDTMASSIPRVAILITVLTPRFVRSDWCLKEVGEFYRLAEQTGGMSVEGKSRIFKIVKTPVAPELHPLGMKQLLGYEFYQVDPTTGKPREFIFNSGPNVDIMYWSKLDDVAYDIFKLLEQLKGEAAPTVKPPAQTSRGNIYLAETTLDLVVERDKIKRELQSRSYNVLPDQPLPLHVDRFEKIVRQNLNKCQLSIHLIGANYGVVPEGSERSVVCLQHELASERRESPNFSRVVWMPPGLHARESRQQEFITYLCEEPSIQQGAEVLQTSLEDLKTIVQDKLQTLAEARTVTTAHRSDGPQRIYLINDIQDQENVFPLSNYLFDQGFEVIPSTIDGDEVQARSDHRESLRICDAILIYYGAASEAWLRTKLFDLRKLAGYGRTQTLLAKAIVIGTPTTAAKERFRTLEATVIKQEGDFTSEMLVPFTQQISATKGLL
jgi:hypothetical protein